MLIVQVISIATEQGCLNGLLTPLLMYRKDTEPLYVRM